MMDFDITRAVEIAANTWWVGFRNPASMLQLNVYLLRFPGQKGTLNYVIDPGSPIDYPYVTRKIAEIIGDISRVHICSINHQDPDVGMNAVQIGTLNPKMLVITSEDTWRLIQHMGLDHNRVRFTEKFENNRVRLGENRDLQFIKSPFCHFRGAFMTYDPVTRILYTGDLFGGLTTDRTRLNDLLASKKSWDGIAAFHEIYMPSKKALRLAVNEIRKLNPKPLFIAPQHGDIIGEELIDDFLVRMENLDVGLDLMIEDIEQNPKVIESYMAVANEILAEVIDALGRNNAQKKLAAAAELNRLAKIANNRVSEISGNPARMLEVLLEVLLRGEDPEHTSLIKCAVISASMHHHLPLPSMEWESVSQQAGSREIDTF